MRLLKNLLRVKINAGKIKTYPFSVDWSVDHALLRVEIAMESKGNMVRQ